MSVDASSRARHLFHDIIFNRGTLDFDDLSLLDGYDEARVSRQLCAVLEISPHLLPYIRRIRASLEVGVLAPLVAFHFPNLHDLVFHRRRGGSATLGSITLAAQLIRTPTLHRVGFISLRFDNLHDMARLFAEHTPALGSVFLHYLSFKEATLGPPLSRVRVKTLNWAGIGYHAEAPWMLEPSSPLDLSALTQLEFGHGGPHGSIVHTVIERASYSLRQLTIDPHVVVDLDRTSSSRPGLLARLPALTKLTLITTAQGAADVVTALAPLPRSSALRALTLQIRKAVPLKPELMRALGVACAESLPRACVVTVHLRRFGVAAGLDRIEEEQLTREAFLELEAGGRLRVVV
ncbi:hypothetical protein C8R46DRAFT_1359348 [Mycena filopes]|nr:hypothetical protein C8R46DRAFT_1359348 [Mycena filopes]